MLLNLPNGHRFASGCAEALYHAAFFSRLWNTPWKILLGGSSKFIPAVMQLSGQYCLPQAGKKPATLAAKVRIKASFPVGLAAMTHAPPNWTLQRSAESVQSSGNE